MNISAVILTKNEETNILECIKTLSFCDQIIVIDDESTDKTLSKLRDLKHPKLKIFKRPLNNDFSQQLNFGLNKTTGEWILFIDPDEKISTSLREEIIKYTNKQIGKKYSGIAFRRIDFMWGRWLKYGEVGSFRSVRLVRRGKGKWVRRVHQSLSVEGPTLTAANPILHYPHQTLRKFISNVNKWSTLHAMANYDEGKKSNLFKIIVFPVAHFIKNYLLRLGFLDGMQGFVYALVMASHSYLSWSKQWMLQKGFKQI